MKKLSLQWRLTLMSAAVAAIACIALAAIVGTSANQKMDEISTFLVLEDGTISADLVPSAQIELAPDFYDKLELSKHTFNTQSLSILLGVILCSSILTYFAAGRSLKPLQTLSETIEQVQAQNLTVPLQSEVLPGEIARLSLSFNHMLERLSQAFTAQKQFSANAAHELRTPLAIMQTKIDVFQKADNHSTGEYAEILSQLGAQTERLSEIVSELLELSQMETAKRSDFICLQALVEEVLCDLASKAEPAHIHLLQKDGDASFYGNETLIYRAIYNLVENAIKYNRPDGSVTTSIQTGESTFTLFVTDTGIGIPKNCQEQIFEPFFRVDKSRSRKMGGAGIGLAMVRSVATLHGGTVSVSNSTPDGTTIAFTLPL